VLHCAVGSALPCCGQTWDWDGCVCYVSPVRALAYNSVLVVLCHVGMMIAVSVVIVVFSVVVLLVVI